MSVSTLPTTPEIEPIFLQVLSDRKERKLSDIVHKLADDFSLTPEQLDERLPSGYKRFYTRVGYAAQNLKDQGLIIKPRYGYCQLSKRKKRGNPYMVATGDRGIPYTYPTGNSEDY